MFKHVKCANYVIDLILEGQMNAINFRNIEGYRKLFSVSLPTGVSVPQ